MVRAGADGEGRQMTTDEDIRAGVREIARDGRVACKELLALAERLGVEPDVLGRVCNELDLRIGQCQLGCFG